MGTRKERDFDSGGEISSSVLLVEGNGTAKKDLQSGCGNKKKINACFFTSTLSSFSLSLFISSVVASGKSETTEKKGARASN